VSDRHEGEEAMERLRTRRQVAAVAVYDKVVKKS
jgi:hypothetical protein